MYIVHACLPLSEQYCTEREREREGGEREREREKEREREGKRERECILQHGSYNSGTSIAGMHNTLTIYKGLSVTPIPGHATWRLMHQ